jgi:hypothetical protein
MSRPGWSVAAVSGAVGAVLVVLALAWPASAAGGLQRCLDQAANHGGEPPTCTQVNGRWVASWPDDGGLSGGGGGGGAIAAVLILGIVGTIVVVAWRVTTAQRLAKGAGLDPRLATQMALLSDDGLDATYLASSLRQPPVGATSAPGAPPPAARPIADRLAELASLRDRGLITQAEHDERRRAILGEV